MPIHESNDSVYWTNVGANQIYKDTAKHRNVPTQRCGPHTIAKEYRYPMLAQLEHRVIPELPAPNFKINVPTSFSTQERMNAWELAIKHSNFVLPQPLVDLALFVSRIGAVAPQYWYYPSQLRVEWAKHEMSIAHFYLSAGDGRKAAESSAKVFGSLLPAMLTQSDAEAELQFFRMAWSTLANLVDGEFFLEKLFKEAKIIVDHRNLLKIKDIWEQEPGLKKYFINPKTDMLTERSTVQRIGPRELTIVEEMKDTERELERVESQAKLDGYSKSLKGLKEMWSSKLKYLIKEYDEMFAQRSYEVLGQTRFLPLEVYENLEPPPILRDLVDAQLNLIVPALTMAKPVVK